MTKPLLVLFDLDDTLYDHSYALRSALRSLRRRYPALRSTPLEQQVGDYNRLLSEQHPLVLDNRMARSQARIERYRMLLQGCSIRTDETLLEQTREIASAAYRENQRAVPGARELLTWLRGRTTVGIVTNNPLSEQQEKLRIIGLDHLIDFMLTSEQTGCRKPDTRIMFQALELGGVEPEQTVMVGDSWDLDIACARSAGIRAVWLNRTSQPCPEPGVVVELRSFTPLARPVKAIGFDEPH